MRRRRSPWCRSRITNANRRNYWFVESLAEYSAAMFIEALRGRKDSGKGWRAYTEHVEDRRHDGRVLRSVNPGDRNPEILDGVPDAEDGHYVVQGEIDRQVVMGEEEYVVPDTSYRGVGVITVQGDDTQTEYPVRVLIEGEKTPFFFKVPEKPYEITLNKCGEILSLDVTVPE